jgi:hypothetical protein
MSRSFGLDKPENGMGDNMETAVDDEAAVEEDEDVEEAGGVAKALR